MLKLWQVLSPTDNKCKATTTEGNSTVENLDGMSRISKRIVTDSCQCYLGLWVVRVKGLCNRCTLCCELGLHSFEWTQITTHEGHRLILRFRNHPV